MDKVKIPERKIQNYKEFLISKTQFGSDSGFEPTFIPDCLFDFQKHLTEWSIRKGRAATFADCGLGKSLMQLVWAENIYQKTGKPVLILTPLSVSSQTVREAHKFKLDAEVSRDGKIPCKITVTNYERLHYFNPDKFGGVVCDESSILKNFDGSTKAAVTEFLRKVLYRALYTATAAPNDYIELGTSSEALGYLGHMDMLGKFFTANNGSLHPMFHSRAIEGDKFRFRGHAERDFWRWVCSWARAVRKPSDLGFSDNKFILPKLHINEYIVKAKSLNKDYLFDMPAIGLNEQRKERRRTVRERCEIAAQISASEKSPCVSWCALNDEGDLLAEIIPEAVQVSGKDSEERKEEILEAFTSGQITKLVTKSEIAGFGQNWQHCHRQTHFVSHSFEQYYQSVRRSYRFGQKKEVQISVIASEGEIGVLKNLKRKSEAAEKMFSNLVELMNNELKIQVIDDHKTQTKIPTWL